MKTALVCLAVCLLRLSAFTQTLTERLDQYATAATKSGMLNGSVLVVQKGRVLLNKGYGYKNADTKELNDENTIYRVGSITKQFTASVILKLEEEKKLSLQDKLSKYLPDFPGGEKITIENLLSHTSGIYSYTNDERLRNESDKPVQPDYILALMQSRPLNFEPGTQFSYSDSGYWLLGYIIEKITGNKYEKEVRDLFITPLQMSHSGFDFTHLQSRDKATGYSILSGVKQEKARIVDSSVVFSAGALYSTTGDLLKWNQSLLSAKFLKGGTLANAFTPRLGNYGLGWSINFVDGKRVISHNGNIYGFLSHNAIVPEDSLSLTVLTNTFATQPAKVGADLLDIIYHYTDKTTLIPNNEVKVVPAVLKQYVGEYQITSAFKIEVSFESGRLKAQATAQPKYDLYAEIQNKFYLKEVSAKVEFIKGPGGKITGLVLYQDGKQASGKKIK